MRAYLVLASGQRFEGEFFGATTEVMGEAVFNTGMTGYQEVLTDPSYAGQMVCFTYPLIGNYGINEDDFESDRIQPRALIVREICDAPSNWRSKQTLRAFAEEKGLTGISGIDTRALTQLLRSQGSTMAILTSDPEGAEERLQSAAQYVDQDYVGMVSTKVPYAWSRSGRESIGAWEEDDGRRRILALDCGLKVNILRRFAAIGVKTLVVPATTSADEILDWKPDGLLLSPGPGDPARLEPIVRTVQQVLGHLPIFGICLGNQILSQAVGGRTFKMKFGHRGSNHPVKDLRTGRVTITSQNHGFAIDPDSLAGSGAEITQINLNDGTVEGICIKGERAESIQYHPEAAPGPWDSRPMFHSFVESLR